MMFHLFDTNDAMGVSAEQHLRNILFKVCNNKNLLYVSLKTHRRIRGKLRNSSGRPSPDPKSVNSNFQKNSVLEK